MAPPRGGRATPRKVVGLGRMDAALDAMRFLGFSDDLVRKTVKNLLKVYGGDEGWLFIEDACYKVLIDAILEGQEHFETDKSKNEQSSSQQQEDNENHHSTEVHSPKALPQPLMGIIACTTKNDTPNEECGIAIKSIKFESLQGSQCHSSSPSRIPSRLTDTFHDKQLAIQIQSKEPLARLPRQRRKPCYGWISSDDEEEDVLTFLPEA